jgi:hypothetical protein
MVTVEVTSGEETGLALPLQREHSRGIDESFMALLRGHIPFVTASRGAGEVVSGEIVVLSFATSVRERAT